MADGQRRNRGSRDDRPSKGRDARSTGRGGSSSGRGKSGGGKSSGPKGRGSSGSSGSSRGGSSGGSGRGSGSSDRTDRSRPSDGGKPSFEQRKKLHAGGQLPRWIREEITRSTPKERREAAIHDLESGVDAYAAERYKQAAASLRKAKAASSRSATIRELLGLASYHLGQWDEALRELRAFRRMSGETDQMPIELDCLRALGRPGDVDKTYSLFHELGGGRDTDNEVRVVYASHLVDQGRLDAAWNVINAKLVASPPESLVRRWAVAARVAHASGDDRAASKFLDAIRDHDAELPWLEDLEAELAN